MSELTVEKVEAFCRYREDIAPIDFCLPIPYEHKDVISNAPVQIYRFLIERLAATEKETAEKCAKIADGLKSGNSVQGYHPLPSNIAATAIRKHFNTGETP